MNKEKNTYGNWDVLRDGTLVNTENDYRIPADRLDETDWIPHLTTKSWMEGKWNEFIPAYVKALELSGLSRIKMPAPPEPNTACG